MKKKISEKELIDTLECLYWTLHRHSKATNKIATLEWLNDKDSDIFASDGCISGTEFEKYMPKARKLLNKIKNLKGGK